MASFAYNDKAYLLRAFHSITCQLNVILLTGCCGTTQPCMMVRSVQLSVHCSILQDALDIDLPLLPQRKLLPHPLNLFLVPLCNDVCCLLVI